MAKSDLIRVAVFEGKHIRKIMNEGEWWFSVVDIVEVLTGSNIPKRYWSDLKRKLAKEGYSELYDKIVQLKFVAADGKYYATDCATPETMFRIIQSIPSPKVEPLKQWLARVGYPGNDIHSTTYLDTEDFSGPLAKTFDDSLAFVMRIAEGAARNTSKEFAQFLYVALGHLTTLRTALQSVQMIKSFVHKGLKAFYEKGSVKGIQANHTKKLRMQLAALDTACVIDDLDIPGYRLHPLHGNRAGIWSITVNGNWRLTFEFIDGNVHVLNYEDYH